MTRILAGLCNMPGGKLIYEEEMEYMDWNWKKADKAACFSEFMRLEIFAVHAHSLELNEGDKSNILDIICDKIRDEDSDPDDYTIGGELEEVLECYGLWPSPSIEFFRSKIFPEFVVWLQNRKQGTVHE